MNAGRSIETWQLKMKGVTKNSKSIDFFSQVHNVMCSLLSLFISEKIGLMQLNANENIVYLLPGGTLPIHSDLLFLPCCSSDACVIKKG